MLTAYGLGRMIVGDFQGADAPTLKAVQTTISKSRLRKRAIDVRLKFYTRKFENLCNGGVMNDALSCLSSMKLFIDSADPYLIDRRMLEQGRTIRNRVLSLRSFYNGSAGSDECNELARWYTSFFSIEDMREGNNLDLAHVEGSNNVLTGLLSEIYPGYGFIDYNKQSIFFHFSEWLEPVKPNLSDVGSDITFSLGSNEKGVCGIKVQKSKKSSDVEVVGKLTTNKGTYGFITTDDDEVYFLSYSHLVDANLNGEYLLGKYLRFTATDERKGRYLSARYVTLYENT